jgi:hypothetical protein
MKKKIWKRSEWETRPFDLPKIAKILNSEVETHPSTGGGSQRSLKRKGTKVWTR